METIAKSLHESSYGLVWDEWYGSGGGRRIVRKELGFISKKAWQSYLVKIAASPNLHQFINGWTPQEELNQANLREIAGV